MEGASRAIPERDTWQGRYEDLIDGLTAQQARLMLYCMSQQPKFYSHLREFVLLSLDVETMTEADVILEAGNAS
jgi:hypothetical protein